jgi:DNA-binding XRE family transcriptional regulator
MAKPISPLELRFWSKVDKTDPDKCWWWVASIDVNGYGQFLVNKGQLGRTTTSMAKAHRVAWLLTRGDIPKGMYLCHTCDMPRCVNPAHLFLGTQKDNMRDCVDKNRHGFGRVGQPIYYNIKRLEKIFADHRNGVPLPEITKRHHISRSHLLRLLKRHKLPLRDPRRARQKLTTTEVAQIRHLYAMGTTSQTALGKRFGVTQAAIGLLVRGVNWPDLDGPIHNARPRATLTLEQTAEIRRLYATGEYTQEALAKQFNVTLNNIHYAIRKRKL